MPSKPSPKLWVVTRDFEINCVAYRKGDEYTPDRYFERLIRGGFVAQKKEPSNGNG